MIKKTEEEIDLLERMLSRLRENLYFMKNIPEITNDLIREQEEEIRKTEESLKHFRDIHRIEVKKSGRRDWKSSALIYSLVYIGGAITIKIVEFILSRL